MILQKRGLQYYAGILTSKASWRAGNRFMGISNELLMLVIIVVAMGYLVQL